MPTFGLNHDCRCMLCWLKCLLRCCMMISERLCYVVQFVSSVAWVITVHGWVMHPCCRHAGLLRTLMNTTLSAVKDSFAYLLVHGSHRTFQ